MSIGNPYLDEFSRLEVEARSEARDRFIARYGFAVPTDDALSRIRAVCPNGVVEIGAGTGYWARLLHDRGVDIEAYDVAPPQSPAGSPANRWFAESTPWYEVREGDESAAADAPPSTLLLVWPTRDQLWPAAAAQRYHEAGGATLVFVGEGPGGRTGDDVLHAVLGEMPRCNQCTYGVANAPCICGVTPLWRRVAEHRIPTWPGFDDTVRIYERRPPGTRRHTAARLLRKFVR
jgi:hypothetical protein